MGYHNPPQPLSTLPTFDLSETRSSVAHEFEREYGIGELNDMDAICAFTVSSGDVVRLETVTILGKAFSADTIKEWLGTPQVEALEGHAQDWWVETGWAKAEDDDAADYGEYLSDTRN